MPIKALIVDLDNTIFPVPSIGEELFKPFFDLLQEKREYEGDFEDIKRDMMRKPFQKVADEYKFSEQLKTEGDRILQELTFEKEIQPFADYPNLRVLSADKFLVTTGYTNMQQSKIEHLGIKQDFKEVHIVDPSKTDLKKKDIFQQILKRHQLDASQVLVIGDDPDSELKAGKELGLKTVLYAKSDKQSPYATYKISDYGELKQLLHQV